MGTRTDFPGSDALAEYVSARREAPRRICENGGGHYTRFLARAFVFVNPRPRAVLNSWAGHMLLRHQVLDINGAIFEWLGVGDVLFVDSSRIRAPIVGASAARLDAF